METLDYRKIARGGIYGAISAYITWCVSALLLSSVLVSGCIDMTMRFGDSIMCSWEVSLIFVISLGGLLSIGTILLQRATRLDIVLIGAITGIGACLFLEYVVEIAGFGVLTPIFLLLLGWVLSGRERWKVTWKPGRQLLALSLILAVVISMWLYAMYSSPAVFHLPLFEHEYMIHIPLMLMFVGELSILIALMHFGKGAKECISAWLRRSSTER